MSVNCEFVNENLSAFVDRELGADSTAAVHAHLAECDSCSRLVLQTKQLDRLAETISTPEGGLPPWEILEARLGTNSTRQTGDIEQVNQKSELPNRDRRNWLMWSLGAGLAVGTAASLFLLAKLNFLPSRDQPLSARAAGEQTSHASLELQSVIERFRVDPRTALDVLRSQYDLTEYSLTEADAKLGRPTYVSHIEQTDGLPGNASPISTVVLSFPSCQCPFGECTCGEGGCNCIVNVCQRPDGSVYLVFEQCRSQNVDFGDLPVQRIWRDGKEMQLVTIEDLRAVTIEWETGKVIVIGLENDDEVAKLAASR